MGSGNNYTWWKEEEEREEEKFLRRFSLSSPAQQQKTLISLNECKKYGINTTLMKVYLNPAFVMQVILCWYLVGQFRT